MKYARSLVMTGISAFTLFAQDNYKSWAFFRDIAVNTSATGANLATTQFDFPVLVTLTSAQADVFTTAMANGADIRFSKPDGTHLPYQIERWDATGHRADIWVKMDTVLAQDAAQHFRMYYGKAGAADSSDGKGVFTTSGGYQGVWHLGSGLEDGTANRNAGTDSGTTIADGRIGQARMFDNLIDSAATGQYISLGNPSSLNIIGKITFEAWIKWLSRIGHRIVICRGSTSTVQNETMLRIGETLDYRTGVWTGTQHHAMYTPPATDSNTWIHLAGVYTGTSWDLYRNGTKVATLADTNGAKTSPGGWRIGAQFAKNGVSRYFKGLIDEVRVSNVARGPDWFKLGYETQKESQTAVTIGAAQSVSIHSNFKTPGAETKLRLRAMGAREWTVAWANNQEGRPWRVTLSDPRGRALARLFPVNSAESIKHDRVKTWTTEWENSASEFRMRPGQIFYVTVEFLNTAGHGSGQVTEMFHW